MLTIVSVVLSVHFGVIFIGKLYRAAPAFVLPKDRLSEMLGKDEAAITPFERCRFYLHCLLAN